jgi:hypothetical protein
MPMTRTELEKVFYEQFDFRYQAGDRFRYDNEFAFLLENFDSIYSQCFTQFHTPKIRLNKNKPIFTVAVIDQGCYQDLFLGDISPLVDKSTLISSYKRFNKYAEENSLEIIRSKKIIFKQHIHQTKTTRAHNHYKVYKKLKSGHIILTTYDHEHKFGEQAHDYVFWYFVTGGFIVNIACSTSAETPSANYQRIATQYYQRL